MRKWVLIEVTELKTEQFLVSFVWMAYTEAKIFARLRLAPLHQGCRTYWDFQRTLWAFFVSPGAV